HSGSVLCDIFLPAACAAARYTLSLHDALPIYNMFNEYTVLETVLMGNKVLYDVKKEMDELYADYTDENADRIGELQMQFDEMNGWNADSDAASLLSNLGISEDMHYTLMGEMEGKLKVRVLLAQALFGN